MSVISQKSQRRVLTQQNRNRTSSNCSGVEFDHQSFLLPKFSAAASEGVKIEMDHENWGENTTVLTGITSELSYSGLPNRFDFNTENTTDNNNSNNSINKSSLSKRCSRMCWILCAFFVSIISLFSPPLMAAIPFLLGNLQSFVILFDTLKNSRYNNGISIEYDWPPVQCEIDCQGASLNMMGKSALLLLTFYVLYWRRAPADMPRLYFLRASFVFFTLFVLFAFWLFYVVRIVLERNSNFMYIIQYALSLADLLLFIHCIWIFFEIRQLRAVYIVTIVRDPDGESHTYQLGQMSIQEAAVHVLRLYHTHFTTYNPYLDNMRQSAILNDGLDYRINSNGRPSTALKFYDIDNRGNGVPISLPEENVQILAEASLRRRMAGRNNDVLYAEAEYERRLNKRRCRLIGCAEECFAHFQAAKISSNQIKQLDPFTTAKVVLSGLTKPLNRYLRFTRQQPYYNQKQISFHLRKCLAYQFSARTFLQKFFSNRLPPLNHNTQEKDFYMEDKEILKLPESKWSILCSLSASGPLKHGIEFVLRSHSIIPNTDAGVQLFCSFSSYPFYNITEQNLPEKSMFELRILSS